MRRSSAARVARLAERLLVLLPLVVGACATEQSSVGTNTNWLRVCDDDSECDEQDACLCARCTRACEADADCPDEFVCALGSAARLQCGGQSTRTCQPPCELDEECEMGRICHQGVCADAAPRPCPSDALVCEDFESDLGGHTPITSPGNEITRIERTTPSGIYALEAEAAVGPSVAYLRADLVPVSTGELFLSAWVHVPEEEEHDVAPLGFWTGSDEDWALRTVIRRGQLELWSYTEPLDGPFALGAPGWHCLQMHLTVGEAPEGQVEVLLDGAPALSASAVDTLPTGGIESLAMGALWAGAPATTWVDRVVLSRSPLSCYVD